MLKTKSKLESLLIEAWVLSGIERQGKLAEVKKYVQAIDTTRFVKEMTEITSNNLLRILLNVGITKDIQPIFLTTFQKNSVHSEIR